MSERVSMFILLCEDEEHRRLAVEYMKRCQIKTDRVRAEVASEKQKGNASQWVLREFPRLLHACRQRAKHTRTLLIVLIDADQWKVQQRRQHLMDELKKSGRETLVADDPIALLIPRWHVETWICALLGETVSEDEDCKDWEKPTRTKIQKAAHTAYDWAREKATPGATCVPSLKVALPEWRKIG